MAFQRGIRSLWLVLTVGLLFSCKFNEQPVKDELVVKNLYKKNCALCHGIDGKLGLAGAGDLTQSVISHEEIIDIITNGKRDNPGKIMTAFKDVLSNKEIEILANFVKELRDS